MECQIDRLKFTSSVYAYHLAARLVLRYLSRKDYKTGVIRMLDEIPAQHRYTVIVLASSLALHTGVLITEVLEYITQMGWIKMKSDMSGQKSAVNI